MKRTDKVRLSIERLTGRGAASVQFGGIVLWGETEDVLNREVQRVTDLLDSCAREHLCLARAVLKKLIRDAGAEDIHERVFSALLGRALRLGILGAAVCSSEYDRNYRIYIHESQRSRFLHALSFARSRLSEDGAIQVEDVEREIFGVRRYNTWSSSLYVIAHLNFLGVCKMTSKSSATIVRLDK